MTLGRGRGGGGVADLGMFSCGSFFESETIALLTLRCFGLRMPDRTLFALKCARGAVGILMSAQR